MEAGQLMPNLRPIRRSQLITPFGVGALVDFRGDESLMTAGLDEWPSAKDECPQDWLVREERLQARLNVTHFRLPPDYRESGRESCSRTSTYRLFGSRDGITALCEERWNPCSSLVVNQNAHVARVSTANHCLNGGVLG